MKYTIISIASAFLLVGCTENQRARNFGGNVNITLPQNEKLVTATWKQGDHLWYLTRIRHTNEVPETSVFREKSDFGIIEGSVTFIER